LFGCYLSRFAYKIRIVLRFDHLVHPWFFIFFNLIPCFIFLAIIIISCLLRLWWSSSIGRWPLGNHLHLLSHIVFLMMKIFNFLRKKKLTNFFTFKNLHLIFRFFLLVFDFLDFKFFILKNYLKLIFLMTF
jgi:hypothetical protein